MITVPKWDIDKLLNDLAAINEGKKFELKYVVRFFPATNNFPEPVTMLEAETGVTTTQWVSGKTPDELLANVRSHLQQVWFQLSTGTQKIAGKRARDRVRLAAKLFREILPSEASAPLNAFSDGDFVFCSQVHRADIKKLEDALTKSGWLREKDTWIQKPKDMKLPENQDRASFFVRIAPVPSMWKVVAQDGREPFEFWFDTMSK